MCPSFSSSCEYLAATTSTRHNFWLIRHLAIVSSNTAISPSNLSAVYPFFSEVTDIASFDSLFARYFRDYGQFKQNKIHSGLQCNETGMRNATLQWSQTVLCGQFASLSYNAGCSSPQNQSTPLVCQETCTQYSDSEYALVANASMCTPTSQLNPRSLVIIRNNTLRNDHDSCTSWTAQYSANNATCISGITNEGNCGWGPGASFQLCSYCDTSNGRSIPSCCYDAKTDLAGCAALGYRAAALVVPTTTVPSGYAPSSTSSPSNAQSSGESGTGKRLSGGQLAGIIVGCILGALLLGALLAWLIFACCCGKRRRRDGEAEAQSDRQGMILGAAGTARASPQEKTYNLSEDTNRNPSISGEKMGYHPASGVDGNGYGGSGYGPGVGATAATAGAGAGAGAAYMAAKGSGNDSANSRPISTATSGTDGRGTTVPSVRCQYTGQEIAPGSSVVAIYPYSAGLSDELDLTPETREELSVVRIYDDGWCLLRRADGREGAAPLVCCQSSKGELPAHMRMGDSTGTGTGSGTTDEETGMTSGAEGGMTSSVGGAVTADEHGFTSDAASR